MFSTKGLTSLKFNSDSFNKKYTPTSERLNKNTHIVVIILIYFYGINIKVKFLMWFVKNFRKNKAWFLLNGF